jgi:hypothetical protein
MKLEIVDIVSPLATPSFIWQSNEGGGFSAASYYGNLKDSYTSALKIGDYMGVPGFVLAMYSIGMYLGADINNKNYSLGYTPNNDYPLLSLGFAGCISNYASGYPGDRNDLVIDYSDPISSMTTNSIQSAGNSLDVSDLFVEGPDACMAEPGARVFLSGGGVITNLIGTAFYYKSGLVNSTINDATVNSPRVLSNHNNATSGSSTTFKLFSRYANDAIGNEIKLVRLDSNTAELRTPFTYNNVKDIPMFTTENMEYSGDVAPGKKIGDRAADYVSIGAKSYLNWSKPLTYGSGTSGQWIGDAKDQDRGYARFSNSVSRSKIQGIHGPQIVMSFDSDNTIPSIVEIKRSKKVFTDSVFDAGLLSIERNTTSQLSTYIVNIKSMNAGIYGGRSLLDRQFTEYISTGCIIEPVANTGTNYVFGGDTFIGLLDYTITNATDPIVDFSTYTDQSYSSEPISLLSQVNHIGALIPMESSVNTHLVNSKTYISDDYNFMIQKEPGSYGPAISAGSTWTATQDHKQYDYNAAYSSERVAQGFVSKLLIDRDDKKFDTRVYNSELKSNDELYDSWIKFKPANFIDVDSKFGEITKLKTFKSRLYFWQDKAFGTLAVNDRSLIKDNNISGLTLGTSGILNRFDYISNTIGFKKGIIGGMTTSPENIYWFDYDNRKMIIFGGDGITSLSDAKGVQIFDRKYNEILITLYGIQDASYLE